MTPKSSKPAPNYRRRTLNDFGPRQQELLIRALTQGVDLNDPLATQTRTNKLEMQGLIHKRTSRKGRTSWRVTDLGRGIVIGHVSTFLHKHGVPSYTTKPWQAVFNEPEVIDQAA